MRLAVTGVTGFIGRHFCSAAKKRGHQLIGLVRSDRGVPDIEQVVGHLSDLDALARLIDCADHLVHIAGIVRTIDPNEFNVANVNGVERAAKAAHIAGVPMLLLSSLAARHPACSAYAQSKKSGELAAASALKRDQLTILRPPAVYGPGDSVTMPIFQQIEHGLMLVPYARDAKFSMIYINDLIKLMLRLIERPETNTPIEPDDGHVGGHSWRQLREIASGVTGKSINIVRLPRPLLTVPAFLCDQLAKILNRPLILSSDKLGELYHPDWVAKGFVRDDWQAQIDFATGADETLAWYRDRNWQLMN